MKRQIPLLACALLLLVSAAVAQEGMDWAYPVNPAGGSAPDNEKLLSIPGSTKTYTAAQIGDGFNPPDWFPDEHPAMPPAVANGRRPSFRACALCHLPSGGGHPESANIAGLPLNYVLRQMEQYKAGNRTGVRASVMIEIANAIRDDETRAASEYFAALKPHSRQKIVESETAPKSFVGGGGMRYAAAESGNEPIGSRIIMIPDNAEGAQRRNPKSTFFAYVPVGSIARGEALAVSGGGKTIPCNICHGPSLQGLGEVPGIAGREPIYMFRQLYDMQQGRRKGDPVALMKGVVEKLTIDDMIALSAYVASREP
ncbi:MAG: c-type cytochrome [Xanthobacteraceae bacterium]